MEGWISLYRKFTEWEWYKDINTKIVFLHLLLLANHKDGKWKGQVIKRGQVVTGRKVLAEDLGITEQNVKTALKKLKSTNEIIIKSTNKYSIVTIVKYDTYQDNNKYSTNNITNNLTNNQPTTNQQLTTNNNDNNDNNIIYFNLLKKYKNKDNLPAGLEVIRNVRADEDYNKLSTDDKISLEMELTI